MGSYADWVKGLSPLAQYRLADAVGATTAADYSGNSRTGTVGGTVTFGRPGPIASSADTAALLDGSTGYVQATAPAGLVAANTVAAEAWVNLTGTPAGSIGVVIAKQRGGTYAWCLNVRNTLKACMSLYDGANNPEAVGATTLSVGAWYYLVGMYDGATLSVFVNGVLDGSLATAISPANSDTILRVGANAGTTPGFYLPATVGQVAVYPSLAAAQVRQNYTEGLASAGVKRPWAA